YSTLFDILSIMIRFIIIVVFLFSVVSFLSLFWPRISNNPRPQPLASIYDVLMRTSLGQQASAVLGVSNEADVDFLSPQRIVEIVKKAFQDRIHDVIRSHALRYLTSRFNDLPIEERKKILEELSKTIDQYSPSTEDDNVSISN
ncbi:MAG: hypothetical protein N3A54_04610, partial [Patescibacteria group bacterium]|nr:hypothetical protein [Patescibacteria group bacterium]